MASSVPSVRLSSGHDMPTVAFCSFLVEPNAVEGAVTVALANGYRHIDTAFHLGNEQDIGTSLKKYLEAEGGRVKREDLFVVSRVPAFGNRASEVDEYLRLSLKNLNLDYLDMYMLTEAWGTMRDMSKGTSLSTYMLHDNGTLAMDFSTDHIALWKALETQVKKGLVRSIGLANFNERQILNLINNCEIKPSYLMVSEYVYHQEKELRKFCAEHDIVLSSFTPLGCSPKMQPLCIKRSQDLPDPLSDPVVIEISKNHQKTPAQVLLRHQYQIGVVSAISGISQPESIKAHIDIFDFELSRDEMEQLGSLDRGEEGRIINDYNIPG